MLYFFYTWASHSTYQITQIHLIIGCKCHCFFFLLTSFPVESTTCHTKKSKYEEYFGEIWPDDFMITQTAPSCPKVMTCLNMFVPYANFDLSQCLSALLLHKTPFPSQKKHSLAMTKSLQHRLLSQNWPSTPIYWFPWDPGHHPCYWVVLKVLTTPPHCFSNFCSQILGKPTSLMSGWDFKAATWQHQDPNWNFVGNSLLPSVCT